MISKCTGLVAALSALWLSSCKYEPNIDANGFTCKSTADCPPNYACVNATQSNPGVCCNRPEAGLCSSQDASGSLTSFDSADSSTFLAEVGKPPVQDSAADLTTDRPVDVPLANDAMDVPDDVPPDASPDASPDVLLANAADVPASGTGGRSGSGGSVDGGGSDGGGSGGTGSVASSVISVNPAAASTDASPSSVISATFSAPMNSTTFTPAAFAVRRGTTAIAGTVAVLGSTATFTPSRPLVLAASYQATIAGGVKDVAGNQMAADYSWTFTARDGAYATSRAISGIGHNTSAPVLAATAGGDAVAAWEQFDDPTHGRTYAAQFSPTSGWFSPALVDTTDISSTAPSLAMSDDGSALTTFTTPAGAASSRFATATGWSATIVLAPGAWNLSLAMDGAGRAVAAYESGGVNAKGFTVAAGWGTEQMLSGNAIFPQVALTSAGTGIASFNAFVDAGEQVYVARYNGTAWLTADPVSAGSATIGNFSAASIDSAGVPVVLWSDSSQAFASRLVGGSWSAAQLVGSAPGAGEVIALSQEPTDTIVAVMSTQPDTEPAELWANVLAGGTWRTAKKLNVIDSPIISSPSVAVAPNGNAMVVWIQGGSVWVARQIEGTGWTLSQKLPDGAATTVTGAARVRMDASGRATIVFSRSDTSTTAHVRAVRFE